MLMVVFNPDHRSLSKRSGALLHRRDRAGNAAVDRYAVVSGGMSHPLARRHRVPCLHGGEAGGARPWRRGIRKRSGSHSSTGSEEVTAFFSLSGGMAMPPLNVLPMWLLPYGSSGSQLPLPGKSSVVITVPSGCTHSADSPSRSAMARACA